ncbi:MAG: type toxin-antitoxin system MqsA family antitoxin [Moraxellaceae bacterium]|jgi:putative zinc finger/helix-turn-helix YgiT family protein|nr:type toxin-antitoxin system MqsA family antitoxin [Moraxellaceae bacterium]
MKCPNCGAATLVPDTRDLPYTYKDETTLLPAVTADWCPACGEAVMAMDESQRVSQAMLEFNKQVNAGLVDPDFIGTVKRKLQLDQREAELAALKQAGHALNEQLASRGVEPEAIVAEFEQARKAGRLQPGDPHDKKTR